MSKRKISIGIVLCLVLGTTLVTFGSAEAHESDPALDGLCDGPWPKYSGNNRNTGLSPYETTLTDGTEMFSYDTEGSVYSSPAVGEDGTIYVGNTSGSLHAVYPDGTEKWTFEAAGRVYSSPALGNDGYVYIGTYGTGGIGTVHAIDQNTGNQEWLFETEGRVISSPAICPDGNIYIGSEGEVEVADGYVYAIDENGNEVWSSDVGAPVPSSPALHDLDGNGDIDAVYIASSLVTGSLHALDPEDGSLIWEKDIGYLFGSSPAIGPNDNIYIGTQEGKLHAFDEEGNEVWYFDVEDGHEIRSSTGVDEHGNIYVSTYKYHIGVDEGYLYSIDQNGNQRWRFNADGAIASSPSIGDLDYEEFIYPSSINFGTRKGTFYSISEDAGPMPHPVTLWTFEEAESHISSSPAIDEYGNIYFGSNDGHLYGITRSHELEITYPEDGQWLPPGFPYRVVNVTWESTMPLEARTGIWMTVNQGLPFVPENPYSHRLLLSSGTYTVTVSELSFFGTWASDTITFHVGVMLGDSFTLDSNNEQYLEEGTVSDGLIDAFEEEGYVLPQSEFEHDHEETDVPEELLEILEKEHEQNTELSLVQRDENMWTMMLGEDVLYVIENKEEKIEVHAAFEK